MSRHPPISVIMPVLNEIRHIDEVLASLAEQDYPGEWELLVAEGGSTDGTRERLESWREVLPNLRVIDNPDRVQIAGVHRAIEEARADVVCRIDGHTTYAPDYLRRSVETLLGSDSVAVGGLMRPVGTTPFGRAVADAMRSPLAVGGKFHYAERRMHADTAYLVTFRKEDFIRAGGYRQFPSTVGEDHELHHRWRREGRTILLDPDIVSWYRPRQTPGALWKQFFRYGWSKAEMLYLNGRFPAWRPVVPLLFVLALLAGIGLSLLGVGWPLVLVVGTWVIVLIITGASSDQPLLTAGAVAIIHLSYGLGLLAGLLRGPGPVWRLQEEERRAGQALP